MPLNILRLNAKKSHPNDRIVFIKPLKGPDEAAAQDFLERIAAQCLPIMRKHHLSVTTLEEHEPNREFVGRNFNAGEVIQLVLKGGRSGGWLPFRYVQMVMMHELAHNAQMNHSRAFWAVRNGYAEEMREIWARGYTGEGMWGRGALLGTGLWETGTVADGEELPEHLCGGTFRSRGGGKRKRKVDWKEQRERRIRKKFGVAGEKLGEDEDAKRKLEGKRVAAKPRVAGSARGRELRAAAALARFEQVKKEEQAVKKEEKEVLVLDEDEVETDSGDETESADDGGLDATEADGRKILDGKGRRMVKVCGDENPDDVDVKNEMDELRSSFAGLTDKGEDPQGAKKKLKTGSSAMAVKKEDDRQRSIVDMLAQRDSKTGP